MTCSGVGNGGLRSQLLLSERLLFDRGILALKSKGTLQCSIKFGSKKASRTIGQLGLSHWRSRTDQAVKQCYPAYYPTRRRYMGC